MKKIFLLTFILVFQSFSSSGDIFENIGFYCSSSYKIKDTEQVKSKTFYNPVGIFFKKGTDLDLYVFPLLYVNETDKFIVEKINYSRSKTNSYKYTYKEIIIEYKTSRFLQRWTINRYNQKLSYYFENFNLKLKQEHKPIDCLLFKDESEFLKKLEKEKVLLENKMKVLLDTRKF